MDNQDKGYIDLLLRLYRLTESDRTILVRILDDEMKARIRLAISNLSSQQNGQRLQYVLPRAYGIETAPVPLKDIARQSVPPVTFSRIGQVRDNALQYMLGMSVLQPLAEKLQAAGLHTKKLRQATQVASPAQIAALRAQVHSVDLSTVPLEGLGLNQRAVKALRLQGVITVADLLRQTRRNLELTPNIGPHFIAEMQEGLRSYHVDFKPE